MLINANLVWGWYSSATTPAQRDVESAIPYGRIDELWVKCIGGTVCQEANLSGGRVLWSEWVYHVHFYPPGLSVGKLEKEPQIGCLAGVRPCSIGDLCSEIEMDHFLLATCKLCSFEAPERK